MPGPMLCGSSFPVACCFYLQATIPSLKNESNCSLLIIALWLQEGCQRFESHGHVQGRRIGAVVEPTSVPFMWKQNFPEFPQMPSSYISLARPGGIGPPLDIGEQMQWGLDLLLPWTTLRGC